MNAIIFDLDGTLADTLDDITDALNAVLVRMDLPPHARTATVEWVGWGVRHLVEHALPPAARDRLDQAVTAFRAEYTANLIRTTAPYPGVQELLDGLTDDGIPLAVLSNKPHDMTRRIMAEVFGRWSFAPVLGKREGVPGKPDPTSAHEIAAHFGLKGGQIAFVGDTQVDLQTATAAGMIPIGVGWGFRPAAALARAAAHVAETPAELLAWIRDQR
ncbi:MAG TPA: HAD family hydrolase [Kofleriaceae bacterium]|nr:HAD family hydrolase [Kofleriaceae bacterium]